MWLLFLAAVVSLAAAQINEPSPRTLRPLTIRVDTPLTEVTAVRELPDGRLLISSAKKSSVVLLDPVKGSVSPVGAAGGGADRYAMPGGLYAGPDGMTLLIDRAQARVFSIDANGTLQGSRSIARRGVSESSDGVDLHRVDARGHVYMVDRHRRGESLDAREATLVRFDPATQALEPLARLRRAEMRVIPAGDGVTLGRQVIGSPADGWGVAPDGRVAVVRAEPYRVEWISPAGDVTSGPVVEYTALPMTDADKAHHAASQRGRVSIGPVGGPGTDLSKLETLFATTKPPFEPGGVLVSPDAHVWVVRTAPVDATTVTYDVFDGRGRRTDRVSLPRGERIAGFGPGVVYSVRVQDNGECELRKYGWK